MNATDFISETEYKELKEKVDKKEAYEHERSITVGKSWYKVRLSGRWHDSWKEKNKREYHLFFGYDYNSSEGIGGCGGINPKYGTYEELKNDINECLKRFKDYDKIEQIRLF